MSEIPTNPKQWAQEAQGALQMALKLLEEDKHQPLLEEHKNELFKYAPVLAAYNRGIRDETKVADMAKFAFKRRLDDSRPDDDVSNSNEINFYIAYFDAHMAIDELKKSDIDTILDYLTKTAH
jgi:hypothetical protein